TDARKAGLLPILELQMRQQDLTSGPDDSAALVGVDWAASHSSQSLSNGASVSKTIGTLEKQWFDNYTAFAVHYAQLSATHKLPYFIIGNGLTSASYDTNVTSYKNDPKGRDRVTAGEPPCLNGRRDCSWRHVIHALRQASYLTLSDHKSAIGGSYQGKLIYAASWVGVDKSTNVRKPEFEGITWWDAVDYI